MVKPVKEIDHGYRACLRAIHIMRGSFSEIGYFGEQSHERSDGKTAMTIAGIAAINEFGAGNAPARPFVSRAFDENVSRYRTLAASAARRAIEKCAAENPGISGVSKIALGALAFMGEIMAGDIRKTIGDVIDPPNAPRTIERKKSSHPLIDTGAMRNAASWRALVPETGDNLAGK